MAAGLAEPRCASERGLAMGGGRAAERRFTVGGSSKSVARCHRSVLAYWKFESISLQQTVRLSPDLASVPGKTRVFRHFGGRAGRQRRQRRAKSSNIAPRRGSVSVGRYFSTAVLPDAVREIGGTGRK
jgi:hypothetical protein